MDNNIDDFFPSGSSSYLDSNNLNETDFIAFEAERALAVPIHSAHGDCSDVAHSGHPTILLERNKIGIHQNRPNQKNLHISAQRSEKDSYSTLADSCLSTETNVIPLDRFNERTTLLHNEMLGEQNVLHFNQEEQNLNQMFHMERVIQNNEMLESNNFLPNTNIGQQMNSHNKENLINIKELKESMKSQIHSDTAQKQEYNSKTEKFDHENEMKNSNFSDFQVADHTIGNQQQGNQIYPAQEERHEGEEFENGKFIRTRDNVTDQKRQMKKPFLRKGSRKEPSAKHRYDTAGSSERDRRLEKLEEMQLQHMDQLQKRIDKINQYRSKSKLKKSTMPSHQHQKSAEGNAKPTSKLKKPDNANDATKQKCNKFSESCSDDVKNVESEAESAFSPPLPSETKRVALSKHSKVDRDIRENNGKSRRKLQSHNAFSPRESVENEMNSFLTQMKWMKKKQEAAMVEAERTRESVHTWARSETDKMNKWVAEQKAMIQRERHKTTNSALIANKESKKNTKMPWDLSNDNNVARISELSKENKVHQASIRKLKFEMKELECKYKLQNQNLRDRVQGQQSRIQDLEEHLQLLEREVQEHPAPRIKNCSIPDGDSSDSEGDVSHDNSPSDDIQSEDEKSFEGSRKNHSEHTKSNCSNHDSAEHGILQDEPTEVWLQRNLEGLSIPSDYNNNSSHIPMQDKKRDKYNEWLYKSHSTNIRAEGQAVRDNNTIPSQSIDSERMVPGNLPPNHHNSMNSREYKASNYGNEAMASGSTLASQIHQTPANHKQAVPSSLLGAEQIRTPCGKDARNGERMLPDGRRIVNYTNQTQKEIWPDGKVIVRYGNGDIKTTQEDKGTVVYYYASVKTTHTTLPDGLEIFQFPNQQTEYHYPDGRKEIIYPDSTKKVITPYQRT